MGFITATIFSGIAYDMIKYQVALTANNIKAKFQDWVIDDLTASTLADELKKLGLSDEMSEIAIERKISASDQLMKLIKEIKPNSSTTIINQTHNGSGDNIGRDKNIN